MTDGQSQPRRRRPPRRGSRLDNYRAAVENPVGSTYDPGSGSDTPTGNNPHPEYDTRPPQATTPTVAPRRLQRPATANAGVDVDVNVNAGVDVDVDPSDAPRPERSRKRREPRERPARRPVRPLPRFAASIGVAFVGFALAYGSGAPVLGHGWNWKYLLAGVVVLAGGVFVTHRYVHRVAFMARIVALAVTALMTAAFVTGVATSAVVDGKPYLSTSPTAKAYHLSHDLLTDLQYVADVDPLLSAEQADARLRYSEYKPASDKLAKIAKTWAAVAAKPESLPSPQFAEVVIKTANAADWASRAMARKAQLIVEPDAAGEADVASWRNTYTKNLLSAGPLLRDAARSYGIDLAGQAGPLE